MNTTNELRNQRARIWEQAKAFLDSHRDKNGILSAEDTETYERMEQDIVNLGKEIDRQDRLDAFERELKAPTSEPLTSKPDGAKMEMKTGRASDEYKKNFWNALRSKYPLPSVTNALQVGTDSEGGYLVPDEFERTLIEALEEENIFRRIATVIHSNSGDRKIPVVASKGTAGWIDEEGLYPESDDSFGQLSLGAYKLGTMIKISEELLNDSAFDMEGYITREFARRIGTKEEEAFFKGDGTGKPLGLLADTGGADIGVTTTGASITADDVIDLYYSLRVPYRKKAKWIMNDSTVSALRKLKDQNGQYLWQPSLVAGTPNTILGCEVISSPFMPSIAAGEKAIAFGDYSYYWIADRQGRTFKRLNELFATTGQVGFLGAQRVDGKLILPEAIKVLKLKGTAASGT
jgi:HK97 family phage major capsid protein